MITKKHIRDLIKDERYRLTYDEIEESSKQITSSIKSLKCFEEAGTLYLYAAFHTEVQTKYLHEYAVKQGKKVAYPKISESSGEMIFYYVNVLQELEIQMFGSMSIYEPNLLIHKKAEPSLGDLIIAPGLAFDMHGSRIGYGGGFYDRYLQRYPDLYKIGVCMDFQLYPLIPSESFDVKMDCIITNHQYYLPSE